MTDTGAALNTFFVRHAAAAQGVPVVDARIPRSRAPAFFLMPAATEATLKPRGKASEGYERTWRVLSRGGFEEDAAEEEVKRTAEGSARIQADGRATEGGIPATRTMMRWRRIYMAFLESPAKNVYEIVLPNFPVFI